MIHISELTKKFDDICAVNHITLDIPDGEMFGLLGTNGAGKTTFLRILAGILEADSGEIQIDGEEDPFCPSCRKQFFYLPDDPYYFPNASMNSMIRLYGNHYPDMDGEEAQYMAETLNLDTMRPLRTFSKGMKRQAFLIMALCSGTKYLLCDEVFDGLDPIVTEVMKNLFKKAMEQRNFTVIMASHKLGDLEDLCGNIAILHKGGVVTAGDLRERAEHVRKFQCVFPDQTNLDRLKNDPRVLRVRQVENFITLTVTDGTEEIVREIRSLGPLFMKEIPLSLEETFIAKMEDTGYDIRKVLQ